MEMIGMILPNWFIPVYYSIVCFLIIFEVSRWILVVMEIISYITRFVLEIIDVELTWDYTQQYTRQRL